jgi:hypothetical protein
VRIGTNFHAGFGLPCLLRTYELFRLNPDVGEDGAFLLLVGVDYLNVHRRDDAKLTVRVPSRRVSDDSLTKRFDDLNRDLLIGSQR